MSCTLDLTQNGEEYPTIRDAQAAAEQTPGMLLAHSEGLALIGLHQALRKPGGFAYENLPYLPGYDTRNMYAGGAQATDWNWGTARMDHGSEREGWGIRIFPASGRVSVRSAVLLVHGNANK